MLDSLANVKARLGITTTADDDFLTQQIGLISDVIEAYCRRKFTATNWIQTFYKESFWRTDRLELFHFPIMEMTEVTIDGVDFDIANLKIHNPTAKIQRKDCGSLFGEEVVIKYMAGYYPVPSPLLDVLDSLVSQRYNKKKSGVDLSFGADVQRISIPGAISIDFDYSLSNNDRSSAYGTIIGNFANVLDDWRSERAIMPSSKLEYLEEDGTIVVIPSSTSLQSKKQDILLDSTDITNQYVDLLYKVEPESLSLSLSSTLQYEGIDYSLSTVAGKTRLTFLNGLASGGASELVSGDILHLTYRY